MTSPFATNFVFNNLSEQHSLQVDAQGVPLQGQVPLTYQVYTGAGGTLAYDGSSCVIIDSVVGTSDLTIDFSVTHNNYGRICYLIFIRTLANDVILDFGTGTVVVAGNPSLVLTSVTIPAGTLPTTGQLAFFDRTRAALLIDPNASAAGATSTKMLGLPWSADATNELNEATANETQWETTGPTAYNDTDLVLSGGSIANTARSFTTATAGWYDVSANMYVEDMPIDICLEAWIEIDNTFIHSYTVSSTGLTGQTMSCRMVKYLTAGQLINVFVGNKSGPVAFTDPVAPLLSYHGQLNITQFI